MNNSSLAVAFELPGGHTLIFPGDAQFGNWLSWDRVEFKDESGKALPVTTKQLLNRAVVYKVGHHGSHNATPVEFLDEVLPDHASIWAAAASVHPVRNWPEIPRDPLLDVLRKHAEHVVRSDQPGPGGLRHVGQGRSPIGVRNGHGQEYGKKWQTLAM